MKLHGFPEGSESEVALRLGEVTVSASPQTLRRLATFLVHVADQMDQYGAGFNHEHFEDFDKTQPARPAFVVTRDF